tara:strand:+ start:291 stop:521 length:231 start_codon:yes stop_codon:yes gene_type:complete
MEKKTLLSKDTMLPLGMVITICAGVVWISTQLNTINFKLDTLENKLEDQWTKRDMENWGLRFKMENPNISIPTIND